MFHVQVRVVLVNVLAGDGTVSFDEFKTIFSRHALAH
jgi:hypothetical protein